MALLIYILQRHPHKLVPQVDIAFRGFSINIQLRIYFWLLVLNVQVAPLRSTQLGGASIQQSGVNGCFDVIRKIGQVVQAGN